MLMNVKALGLVDQLIGKRKVHTYKFVCIPGLWNSTSQLINYSTNQLLYAGT